MELSYGGFQNRPAGPNGNPVISRVDLSYQPDLRKAADSSESSGKPGETVDALTAARRTPSLATGLGEDTNGGMGDRRRLLFSRGGRSGGCAKNSCWRWSPPVTNQMVFLDLKQGRAVPYRQDMHAALFLCPNDLHSGSLFVAGLPWLAPKEGRPTVSPRLARPLFPSWKYPTSLGLPLSSTSSTTPNSWTL